MDEGFTLTINLDPLLPNDGDADTAPSTGHHNIHKLTTENRQEVTYVQAI